MRKKIASVIRIYKAFNLSGAKMRMPRLYKGKHYLCFDLMIEENKEYWSARYAKRNALDAAEPF